MFLVDVTELRRLTTVRQEFVANLTHELKTPLTSLRLAIETLHGKPSPADQERFLRRALREADQLDGILDNLRQLADLESEALRVRRTRFKLGDLVEDVRERLRYDRPLTVDIEPDLEVEADETKTAQVLANLFDNAARFSPPGSAVDVSARNENGELVIRVRDHGPGLAPEHWGRVFERFYKVDPARPRQSGGSGLGLSISRHLVLAQGGRIWTEAAEGGGQVFAFALPATKP
jgi:two-component system phosphate regulon sensor histidine kinase PhoR